MLRGLLISGGQTAFDHSASVIPERGRAARIMFLAAPDELLQKQITGTISPA
jgi:hypothetical protein